jgi:hypothetical protein
MEDISDYQNPVSGNGNTHTIEDYTIGEEIVPQKQRDPVKQVFIQSIGQLLPTTSWPDIPKQMEAITAMAEMTRATQPQTPIENPEAFAQIVVSTYVAMKRKAKSDYWKTASFEPKAIQRRFGDVVTEISRQYSRHQEVEVGSDPF